MQIKSLNLPGTRIHPGSHLSSLLLTAAVLLGLGGSLQRCAAQTFPAAAGDEPSYSIGVFQLTVDPAFAYLFTPHPNLPGNYYYPGFSPGSGVLTSPMMYDFTDTKIAVSASHIRNVGSPAYFTAPDPGGVRVGTSAVFGFPDFVPAYSSYAFLPSVFATAPDGIDEIMTEIESFNLATTTGSSGGLSCSNSDTRVPSVPASVNMVVAGPAYIPNLPQNRRSIGMVQQYPSSAPSDFPAQSFFDIFVDVTLPPIAGNNTAIDFPGTLSGIPLPAGQTQDGAVLYNDPNDPLVIINANVTSLPPTAVYIHGMTVAVPMKFKYANPPYWAADEVMGYLVLAGHGVIPNPSNNCAVVASAITSVLDQTLGTNGSPISGMPVPWLQSTASYPTPGSGYNSIVRTFVDPSTGHTNVNEDTVSFAVGTQTLYLRDLSLGSLGSSATLPTAGNSSTYSSSSTTVNFQISENGVDFYPAALSGSDTIEVFNTNGLSGNTTVYSQQLTDLSADGSWVGGTIHLRESPTPALPSIGDHTVASDPRGFRVSSFFDVFLEISTDDSDWYAASKSTRVLASMPPAFPGTLFVRPPFPKSSVVLLQWQNNFTLQSSSNLSVPFTDVPGPITNGAYPINPAPSAAANFYRLVYRP